MQQKSFHRIGLFCDHLHNETANFIPVLVDYLKNLQRQVVATEQTAQLLPTLNWVTQPTHQLAQHCDLIIAIGGDGSLLRAALIALDNNLPILGINRGHLGFLTALPAGDLDILTPILNGHYTEARRLVLQAQLFQDNQLLHTMRALNDIVLTHSQATHMLNFDVSTQTQRICSLRADGYIVATPTGSTAYALSAGGPILEPCINAFSLVPMFPHSLTNRPLVISADNLINICLHESEATAAIISADGQVQYNFKSKMHCNIKRNATDLRLIQTTDHHFFSNLSDKLSWHSSTKRR